MTSKCIGSIPNVFLAISCYIHRRSQSRLLRCGNPALSHVLLGISPMASLSAGIAGSWWDFSKAREVVNNTINGQPQPRQPRSMRPDKKKKRGNPLANHSGFSLTEQPKTFFGSQFLGPLGQV